MVIAIAGVDIVIKASMIMFLNERDHFDINTSESTGVCNLKVSYKLR